ncbi:MAG: hypothetical protein KA754_07385, partial [Corallincola sp.]|nr:hypothetical protein [Corallincola sp.]
RGGWDVAANRPKPMHSYLMAGTTLFCDMPDMPWAKLTELLHGACWGGDDFGQGQVVIGWWKN